MSVLTDIAADVVATESVVVTPGTLVVPLCRARPNRYAIGFAMTDGSGGRISTRGQTTILSGIILPPNDIVWIKVKDQGPLAYLPWYEVSSIAGLTITVFEIYLPGE